jgi:signal recognition particle subunit SEC65
MCQDKLKKQAEGTPMKKISLFDFSADYVQQDMVVKFIQDNPDYEQCFDSSWFVLDMNFVQFLHKYDQEKYNSLRNDFTDYEARVEKVEANPKVWDYFAARRIEEAIQNLESKVIPGHPLQYPQILWEEQNRGLREKDKEYATMLSSVGNSQAVEWQNQSLATTTNAKKTIESLIKDFDAKIRNK